MDLDRAISTELAASLIHINPRLMYDTFTVATSCIMHYIANVNTEVTAAFFFVGGRVGMRDTSRKYKPKYHVSHGTVEVDQLKTYILPSSSIRPK